MLPLALLTSSPVLLADVYFFFRMTLFSSMALVPGYLRGRTSEGKSLREG